MKFERHYTATHPDPYHGIVWEKRELTIKESDGSTVFSGNATVPSFWSQTAAELLASKYFWRGGGGKPGESDARQVFDRLVKAWTQVAQRQALFDSKADAEAYSDEMRYGLAHQIGSPNSPQWFNTGLFEAYGVTGPVQGHWFVEGGKALRAKNSYEHPQAHACFIQSVGDDLVNAGGIMDLWVREARLFKFGSGSGTNFSSLRGSGEALAGGGASSGLLSFLRIGDAAAGAIRSGGTTRRAAKMVVVDIDHPDVEAFIDWKAREERKVSALLAGATLHRRHLKAVWEAFHSKGSLEAALESARREGIPETYLADTLLCAKEGRPAPEFLLLDADWRNEAYASVSGQNSNNSVRVSQGFLEAVEQGENWDLTRRSDRKAAKQVPARRLWRQIAQAAWECADPGVQFSTAIDEWHTCPQDGAIRASNPCSEYLFLDDTGCNLASLNLLKFYNPKTDVFDAQAFRHCVRLWTVTLEVTVEMAGYPSEAIAQRSHAYRTLGLGYANLGALLMGMGIPYSSAKAAGVTGVLTALMTGEAYRVSAELAAALGPFERWTGNRDAALRVLRNHQAVVSGTRKFDGLSVAPVPMQDSGYPTLLQEAQKVWTEALEAAQAHGLRNAQVTAIAPTGTIGLVMDCDTMGIEPEFSLVKYKTLAGGGLLKIANRGIAAALERLGYSAKEIAALKAYAENEGTIEGAPGLKTEHLPVFDCAQAGGTLGKRSLAAEAHLAVVAAAQAFVSGGVSKTISLPTDASVADIEAVYRNAWKLGLKAVSVYRSGSKLSQPMGSVKDKDDPSCVECG